jgi:cysteine desulfuration protein SufE
MTFGPMSRIGLLSASLEKKWQVFMISPKIDKASASLAEGSGLRYSLGSIAASLRDGRKIMESILTRKDRIMAELKGISDKDERLKAIIEYGKNMPELPAQLKIDPFLVKGCISRAWLVPQIQEGRLRFMADSEAMIVKGIIALLLQVYNDSTAEEIKSLSPEFLAEAGITELLSMNRRNGLRNVLSMIQTYADRMTQQA